MSRRLRTTLLWAALCAAALVVQLLPTPVALRFPVTAAFIVVAPGAAVIRLFKIPSGWLSIGLTIAISLSLAMLVSTLQVYVRLWSPVATTGLLAAWTIAAHLWADYRTRPTLARALAPARPPIAPVELPDLPPSPVGRRRWHVEDPLGVAANEGGFGQHLERRTTHRTTESPAS